MNKKLTSYIIKRILLGVLTYFLVVTITFWLMQIVPGGPFSSEKAMSEAALAELNRRYGLDQPLFVQYLRYIGCAFRFDFGVTYTSKGTRTVTDVILEGFSVSLPVGALAALLALLIGLVLGTYAATHQNKFLDRLIMVLTTASVAIPSFVISLILLYVFAVTLHIFPTTPIGAGIEAYILPVIAESLYPMAYITRLMRSSTLDVIGQDYMRTARAKGLTNNKILYKHGLRNSITPVITYFGPMFASIITGSFVVEKVFSIPGIGREFIKSINNRDYPLIMGTTCLLALLLIAFTLLSDLAYIAANPRVDFD